MNRPGNPSCSGHRSLEGQPRPGEDARQPTAAERVRTLLESNASAAIAIPGLVLPSAGRAEAGHTAVASRAVTPSGDLYLLVPAGSPAARATAHAQDDEVTGVMEITDVAPVAVPHRIRGRGWVAGWLTPVTGGDRARADRLLAEHGPAPDTGGRLDPADFGHRPAPGDRVPGWALLRLEVGEAYIDDLWGTGQVEPDEFAGARPDPVIRHEAELLQHMASAHGTQLLSLHALLDQGAAGCPGAWQAVAPLSLDRFGLRVRFRGEGTCFDARFEFPEPIRDLGQVRHALHWLFEAAAAG